MRVRSLLVIALIPALFTGYWEIATALILSVILFSAHEAITK